MYYYIGVLVYATCEIPISQVYRYVCIRKYTMYWYLDLEFNIQGLLLLHNAVVLDFTSSGLFDFRLLGVVKYNPKK